MQKPLKHYARARVLRRCDAGITTIEFAIIAPVFLLLIMGIVEFSLIMFATSVMESATNETSRLGKTGFTPTTETREQAIVSNVDNLTAGLLDPTKIVITSKVYANWQDVGQPEPCISPPTPPCGGTAGVNFIDVNGNGVWDADMGAAGLGNPGDVVVYTVSYPWAVMTPLIQAIAGTTFNITARAVVRNEPYGGAGGR